MRRIEPSDPAYIEDVGELAIDFRTDLLGDHQQFHIPLVLVNHEARRIGLSWLDKQVCSIYRE